jgi:hypothetical protein
MFSSFVSSIISLPPFCFLYTAAAVAPLAYRLGFNVEAKGTAADFDLAVDAFFGFDILLNFVTGKFWRHIYSCDSRELTTAWSEFSYPSYVAYTHLNTPRIHP